MMRRIIAALVACAAAVIVSACGGSSITPSPTPGGSGGGGSGGGQQPPPVNTPPQVKSITVSNARVEAGSPVTLTAVVEDAETPVAGLSFAWTFPAGSITGSGDGSTVTYTPSVDLKTPGDFEIGVSVTERYTSNGVQLENKATGSVTLHVNNSLRELAELSLRFLGDFATSSVTPERCVAEFSDSCAGKKDEFSDISNNRHDFLILSSTLRPTSVDLNPSRLKATVHTFCGFSSRIITTQPRSCSVADCPFNTVQKVEGDCFTTNVYEQGRWWICESHFNGQLLSAAQRAFLGLRQPDLP
jgi:hypothetical protein